MKLTLQTQLFPDRDHAERLKGTVERFNEAADWLAGEAFDLKVSNKIELQKTHYAILRERFGLSAQMTVRCIAQACEAYKRDKTRRPRFTYKAGLAGVPIVKVDPRDTSRTCSECGHCCKDNRKSQAKFLCVSCGMSTNADQNAALNLRFKAQAASKTASGLASLRA